jgi:hypothetical protein
MSVRMKVRCLPDSDALGTDFPRLDGWRQCAECGSVSTEQARSEGDFDNIAFGLALVTRQFALILVGPFE